jgi:cytochrome c553
MLLSRCERTLQAAETTERQSFDAAALYRASCAPCHGMAGDGDGPVAAVLASEVPRLDDLTKRNEGVYPAEYVRDVIDGRSEIRLAHMAAGRCRSGACASSGCMKVQQAPWRRSNG